MRLPRSALANLAMTMPADSPNGEHCVTCWAIISGVEDAHQNENGDWEHDECPGRLIPQGAPPPSTNTTHDSSVALTSTPGP